MATAYTRQQYNADKREAENYFNYVKNLCKIEKEKAKEQYDNEMKHATTQEEKNKISEEYEKNIKKINEDLARIQKEFNIAIAKIQKKWEAVSKKKTGKGSYRMYMGSVLMPVCPPSIEVKINNQNETINLLNGCEINIVKKAGLTDIKFELLIPNVKYPFAVYKHGFKRAYYYLKVFESLKNQTNPFSFIFYRQLPDGTNLYQTAMKVTLEDYTMNEDAENGPDVTVSIKLKQHADYGAKTAKIQKNGKIVSKKQRAKKEISLPTVHTVKKTDTIWSIAKKYYGSELKYFPIYKENKRQLKTPEDIKSGMKLMIPKS